MRDGHQLKNSPLETMLFVDFHYPETEIALCSSKRDVWDEKTAYFMRLIVSAKTTASKISIFD